MNISVFGIGYVGAVAAACLARDGFEVVAIDVNVDKVDGLNQGRSPIIEPGLDVLVNKVVRCGKLRATCDVDAAINTTDVSFVCVGTPSLQNGSLDTTQVTRVAEQIGRAIAGKASFHSVVVRSTILPGIMEQLVIPALEQAAGKHAGEGFGVAYYPEFLREGSAIADYDQPGAIIFGIADEPTSKRLQTIHANSAVKPQLMNIRAAEAIKYANNAWHAVKISFANEIGLVCKALGVDSFDVMEALCADQKLNISATYLRPGFAFGGSCLPKDLRAFRYRARALDVDTPMLDAALSANQNQLEAAYRLIERAGCRRIGLVGLSFKPETDDLRHSPYVDLAERLIGRGFNVKIYDPIIRLSNLRGANQAYVLGRLPHIAELLLDRSDELLAHSEVVVVANRRAFEPLAQAVHQSGVNVIDLVRCERSLKSQDRYHGLCW